MSEENIYIHVIHTPHVLGEKMSTSVTDIQRFLPLFGIYNTRRSLLFCVYFPGTIAEGAPIIPISAQLKYNIDVVCEYVTKKIPVPLRDFTSEPRLIGKESMIYACSEYEPQREKTCLRGFRPGLTQTGLYSHRRWLEDLESREIVLSM